MAVTYHEASASDLPAIRTLLSDLDLPTESLNAGTTQFVLVLDGSELAGVAGFEFYGTDALLRSVGIPRRLQGMGIGARLVDHMIQRARRQGVKRIVLLTETAQSFFARKGFVVVGRSAVRNPLMEQSSEFAYACPASAACMILDLR